MQCAALPIIIRSPNGASRVNDVHVGVATPIGIGETAVNTSVQHELLGIAAYRQGDYCQAVLHFEALLGLGESNSKIGRWRANALYLNGQYQQAIRSFLDVLDADPNDAPSLHQLAMIFACCPDDSVRNGMCSLRYAVNACQATNWKNWIYVSGLAAAHAELGDFSLATRLAWRSFHMAPEAHKAARFARVRQYHRKQPLRSGVPRLRILDCVDQEQPTWPECEWPTDNGSDDSTHRQINRSMPMITGLIRRALAIGFLLIH